MPVTYTNLTALLKYRYGKRLWNAVEKDTPIWNMIESGKLAPQRTNNGYRFIEKFQIGRSSGIVYGSRDQAAYPASGENRYVERYWDNKYIFGACQVHHVLEALASGSEASGLQGMTLLAAEMKGFKEKLTETFNKICYGNGDGTLATVTAFSSGTPDTVTVDTTRHLEVGMSIDFVAAGSTTEADAQANCADVTITAITSETTFTATITGTPIATDKIVLANSYYLAPHGFAKFAATSGTYGGVNLASYYEFQPTAYSNSGTPGTNAAFNPRRYMTFLNTVEARGRNTVGDFQIANPNVVAAIMWRMLPDIRRAGVTGQWELFPRLQTVTINGRTIVMDFDSPANILYYFKRENLAKAVIGEPGWDDTGGVTVRLPVDSSTSRHAPAAVVYWKQMCNMVLLTGRGFGAYDDISEISDADAYGDYGGTA